MSSLFIEHYQPSKKEAMRSNSLRAYVGKAEQICWFQSELEYWVHLLLDADPTVVRLIPHGFRINHKFTNRETWLLDSIVRWKGGISKIVEIKPDDQLIENDCGDRVPVGWDELTEWCFHNGFEAGFYTDRDVVENVQLVWNWHQIRPYIQLSHQIPNPQLEEKLVILIEQLGDAKLSRLVAECPDEVPQTVLTYVFSLLHRGVLVSDLDINPLSVTTRFGIAEETLSFQQAAVTDAAARDSTIPMPIYGLRSESNAIDPDDPSTWPPYPQELIVGAERRELFRNRKRIVDARLLRGRRASEIAVQYGIKPGEVGRLVRRCKRRDKDGNPLGYSGIVPGRQIVERSIDMSKTGNTSSALGRVFIKYPEIEKEIVARFLNKSRKKNRKERRKSHKAAWKLFLRLCRAKGFGDDTWPFSASRRGREAIRRYLNGQAGVDIKGFVKSRFGEAIARLLEANKPRERPPEVRPYAIVQIDGHTINSETSISVDLPDGTAIDMPAGRNLVLLAVDIAESAILGFAVIPYSQHSIDDLLDCVASFVEPWAKADVPEFEKSYKPGAAMPGSLFKECEWRACDVVQLDNALAHLSRDVQERIIETVGCVVQVGFPKTPTSRQVVERAFGTIEEDSFNRLPTTTGTGPSDPRVSEPAKNAISRQLRQEHCEALIDVSVKNHNRTPSKKIHGRSPLQYLAVWLAKNSMFVRNVPVEVRADLPLYFKIKKDVTIQGNLESGHSGYIEFLYSRYKNDRIVDDGTLIKTKADIAFDRRDLRSIHIYAKSGEYLGEGYAQDRWCLRKHGYRERVLVGRWMNQQIHGDDIADPVGAFRDEVERQAVDSKRARRRLADQRRRGEAEPKTARRKRPGETLPAAGGERRSRNWVKISKTTLR